MDLLILQAIRAALVLVFAAHALVYGIFAIRAGVRTAERQQRWWPFVVGGAPG